jgi:hypothetical protein
MTQQQYARISASSDETVPHVHPAAKLSSRKLKALSGVLKHFDTKNSSVRQQF